ncbi:MAG TPA: FecR domain-containing protein [Niabella sp.]|nr:FecR domain-containing protein [Niabella sp.]
MENEADIWALMARCAFNEATEAEYRSFQARLQQNPELQQQYDWLLQLVSREGTPANDFAPEAGTINKILSRALLENEQQFRKERKITNRTWAIAASITALIIAGYFLFFSVKQQPPAVIALKPLVTQATAMQEATILPDGSKVWLNAGSKLFFENDFKGATREVRLVGEAFFDIAKNPARPFIVHINDVNINVLGTAFNVKGYEEDKEIQTTLYRGLVKVTKNNDSHFQPIMLYPNQKIVIPKVVLNHREEGPVDHHTAAIALLPVDSTVKEEQRTETAWIYGRIDFKGESLEQVTNKMAYRYQVSFVFEDEAAKQLNFTGSFEKETLEEALKALQTAIPFHYKINAHEVIISTR